MGGKGLGWVCATRFGHASGINQAAEVARLGGEALRRRGDVAASLRRVTRATSHVMAQEAAPCTVVGYGPTRTLASLGRAMATARRSVVYCESKRE